LIADNCDGSERREGSLFLIEGRERPELNNKRSDDVHNNKSGFIKDNSFLRGVFIIGEIMMERELTPDDIHTRNELLKELVSIMLEGQQGWQNLNKLSIDSELMREILLVAFVKMLAVYGASLIEPKYMKEFKDAVASMLSACIDEMLKIEEETVH
jgi:hypothetical protein